MHEILSSLKLMLYNHSSFKQLNDTAINFLAHDDCRCICLFFVHQINKKINKNMKYKILLYILFIFKYIQYSRFYSKYMLGLWGCELHADNLHIMKKGGAIANTAKTTFLYKFYIFFKKIQRQYVIIIIIIDYQRVMEK